jgi:hypothetical protein
MRISVAISRLIVDRVEGSGDVFATLSNSALLLRDNIVGVWSVNGMVPGLYAALKWCWCRCDK